MPRGRPVRSEIRQNIVDILYLLGESYGYEIHKIYINIFPRCTSEVIYYHLRKGVALEEFAIKRIKTEKGEYSWGGTAEKIYYKLGPNANPRIRKRIKRYLDKRKR